KNFLLIPILVWARRRGVPPGRLAAWFLFLYPALRIPIDLFRDYHAESAATGQAFNVIMAGVGLMLLARNYRSSLVPGPWSLVRPWSNGPWWVATGEDGPGTKDGPGTRDPGPRTVRKHLKNSLGWRRAALAVMLIVPLIIPSDSTRDAPVRYGARHPGLEH